MITLMSDCGASCHMTGNTKELRDVKKIIPVPIGLPNGTHTVASHQGTMYLRDELNLTDVLYVPTLKCNLISIVKLFRDMGVL